MKIRHAFGLAAIAFSFVVLSASGQMTTGSAMEDFGKSFNLSAKGWTVQQIGCN